jgi:hypothetical protein
LKAEGQSLAQLYQEKVKGQTIEKNRLEDGLRGGVGTPRRQGIPKMNGEVNQIETRFFRKVKAIKG